MKLVVQLVVRASNSSSMARRQRGLARASRTVRGSGGRALACRATRGWQ
jgi:hypothetical protein